MKAFSHTAIEFDGRTFGPGVFDVNSGEFASLALRGPVRPATNEEASGVDERVTEAAAVRKDSERATSRRSERTREAA